MRVAFRFRGEFLREVIAYVTPYALHRIMDQKVLLDRDGGDIPPCTGQFLRTMGLPCSHLIQKRLQEPTACLELTDIHYHWRYKPTPTTRASGFSIPVDHPRGPVFSVTKPPIIQGRGRPRGSLGNPPRPPRLYKLNTPRSIKFRACRCSI